MNKIVQRLIIKYLLKHNTSFSLDGKTVRVFSDDWYKEKISSI